MNSITNCKEGVELAAFRARMSKAKQRQIDEGQVVTREKLPADKLRNERIKTAIERARCHLLDLFFLEFHTEEVNQIEAMFVDLELKRLDEL